MRNCLRLLTVYLILTLSSCGAKKNDSIDLSPRIESENAELISIALNNDKDFFQKWSNEKMYEGFILDIANASDKMDIKQYATKRFKAFAKEQRYKSRQNDIRYILYCTDSHEVFLKTTESGLSIIDGTHPGELYRLSIEKYSNASEIIKKFSELNSAASRDYENLSRIKKIGLTNPILETVKLALSKAFIPSDSFWFRFFFSLPFGAAMTGVSLFGSVTVACVFFLILFIICNMAYVRRDTRGSVFNISAAMAWGASVLAFFSFCCLVNSLEPSADLRFGMLNYGYTYVFNSYYALSFAHYTKTVTSTFFVIAIAVLYTIDALLSYLIKKADAKEDDNSNDNPLGGLVAVITGAIVSDSTLAYIVLAYLLFRVIRTLYDLFSFVPKRSFNDWPVWVFVGIVLLMFLAIPFVVDDSSHSDCLRNTLAVLWGSMALSGAFHFIHICSKKESMNPLLLFICQTHPKENWNIANSISLNMYFAAGLTSPIFFLICLVYALFPDHTPLIDEILLYSIIFGSITPIAILYMEADEKHNLSSFINSSWQSIVGSPMNAIPRADNRNDIILVRLLFAFSWMTVLAVIVFLLLFIKAIVTALVT